MRKIIETTSTLALWLVFIVGSGLAISDFFFNKDASDMMMLHLSILALAPAMAIALFGMMMISVRSAKSQVVKKVMTSEHAVSWSFEELQNAQSGKIVDLHFQGSGLACNVVTREESAAILHNENQTTHVTVALEPATETTWAFAEGGGSFAPHSRVLVSRPLDRKAE